MGMGFAAIISEKFGGLFLLGVCMKSENVSRFEGDFIMFLH